MSHSYKLVFLSFVVAVAYVLSSCSSSTTTPAPTVIKQYTVSMSTMYELSGLSGRTETGTTNLTLYSDNTLKFTINVSGLNSGDALTMAHIHAGGLLVSGGVLVGLVDNSTVKFSGSTATGTISVTSAQASAISAGTDLYVNVHSTLAPNGLLRGQLDKSILWAADIVMSPANEVPVVTGRTDTGIATFRLTSDSTLYYYLNVTNVAAGDALISAHIHEGVVGVNGGVLIALAGSAADINVAKSIKITPANVLKLVTASLYVNVHSNQQQNGLMRGQIR